MYSDATEKEYQDCFRQDMNLACGHVIDWDRRFQVGRDYELMCPACGMLVRVAGIIHPHVAKEIRQHGPRYIPRG